MSVYRPDDVAVEPEAILRDWFVFEVDLPGLTGITRHFAGWNMVTRDGRVSSPIQTFDAETGIGVTRSGRRYQLLGETGADDDAEYVMGQWLSHNGLTREQARNVSDEYRGVDPTTLPATTVEVDGLTFEGMEGSGVTPDMVPMVVEALIKAGALVRDEEGNLRAGPSAKEGELMGVQFNLDEAGEVDETQALSTEEVRRFLKIQ